MNTIKRAIEANQEPTNIPCPDCPESQHQDFSSLLSEVPVLLQGEAKKFVRFTATLLARLNSIPNRVCGSFLEELRDYPESYDQLSGYHVELLARSIRRELDVLYQCLKVNTMDIISLSYEKWVREDTTDTTSQP